MKKIIIVLLLFAFVSPVFAQTEELNLQKYWYYRYRLKQYFMVDGDGPGMSIPAKGRNRDGGFLNWQENPIIDLGHYIGVLATEHALLVAEEQETEETERELFVALSRILHFVSVKEAEQRSKIAGGY